MEKKLRGSAGARERELGGEWEILGASEKQSKKKKMRDLGEVLLPKSRSHQSPWTGVFIFPCAGPFRPWGATPSASPRAFL